MLVVLPPSVYIHKDLAVRLSCHFNIFFKRRTYMRIISTVDILNIKAFGRLKSETTDSIKTFINRSDELVGANGEKILPMFCFKDSDGFFYSSESGDVFFEAEKALQEKELLDDEVLLSIIPGLDSFRLEDGTVQVPIIVKMDAVFDVVLSEVKHDLARILQQAEGRHNRRLKTPSAVAAATICYAAGSNGADDR